MSVTEGGFRELAAIMFTDMVGYSALMQRSEGIAVELVEEHRRLLRSIFPTHSGREIETAGDSFLVEFDSTLHAVRCAIEIQSKLHERNSALEARKRIHVRVGIHVGEVLRRENHVYGDGVNIAARIQPLADPGGICISEDVAKQIQNKLDLRILKLGRRNLKNIHTEVDICAIALPWSGDKIYRSNRLSELLNKWKTYLLTPLR